jgi:uncharacterized membrane protein
VKRALFVACALALSACGPEPGLDPTTTGCADAPLQTWETFGKGFLRAHCQGCHGSQVVDRQGAPTGVEFDEHDVVVELSPYILRQAGGDEPAMPPAGGVPADDRERLRLWIECFQAR